MSYLRKDVAIMALGVSTACFYPEPTEEALRKTALTGAKVTEIFFNAPSELEKGFLNQLNKIKEDNGMNIKSIHPYTSFAEGYLLFSLCERRFKDYREFYKKYYETAAYLGAKIVVFHGAKDNTTFSFDCLEDRLGLMIEDAREQGIILAQENVVHHNGQSPELMRKLRKDIGEHFKMVIDIKQAKRANFSAFDFIDEFSDDICHFHISDHNSEKDCIPPGMGAFDFEKFFAINKRNGYKGDYVIELYRAGFKDIEELTKSFNYIKNFA